MFGAENRLETRHGSSLLSMASPTAFAPPRVPERDAAFRQRLARSRREATVSPLLSALGEGAGRDEKPVERWRDTSPEEDKAPMSVEATAEDTSPADSPRARQGLFARFGFGKPGPTPAADRAKVPVSIAPSVTWRDDPQEDEEGPSAAALLRDEIRRAWREDAPVAQRSREAAPPRHAGPVQTEFSGAVQSDDLVALRREIGRLHADIEDLRLRREGGPVRSGDDRPSDIGTLRAEIDKLRGEIETLRAGDQGWHDDGNQNARAAPDTGFGDLREEIRALRRDMSRTQSVGQPVHPPHPYYAFAPPPVYWPPAGAYAAPPAAESRQRRGDAVDDLRDLLREFGDAIHDLAENRSHRRRS